LFAHWDKVRELAEARANLRASQRNEARLNDMLLRAYGGRRQVPEPPLLLAETQPRVVINSVRVRELLTGQMTEEEVQTLAYDLELEDIPGGPKSGQVRALLVAVETRKRWGALLETHTAPHPAPARAGRRLVAQRLQPQRRLWPNAGDEP
jgi:hypothetical protein